MPKQAALERPLRRHNHQVRRRGKPHAVGIEEIGDDRHKRRSGFYFLERLAGRAINQRVDADNEVGVVSDDYAGTAAPQRIIVKGCRKGNRRAHVARMEQPPPQPRRIGCEGKIRSRNVIQGERRTFLESVYQCNFVGAGEFILKASRRALAAAR